MSDKKQEPWGSEYKEKVWFDRFDLDQAVAEKTKELQEQRDAVWADRKTVREERDDLRRQLEEQKIRLNTLNRLDNTDSKRIFLALQSIISQQREALTIIAAYKFCAPIELIETANKALSLTPDTTLFDRVVDYVNLPVVCVTDEEIIQRKELKKQLLQTLQPGKK